ncbi:hypothetical protein JSQ81_15550 [Sporosarcina sp. Marseille-Q4063]|uniref:glycoside hydrolase family 26 protein n=1 Tax=Sporosarcina sp. Marseille-Q4063 TaxID=2810514 RepID=UPI001BAEC07A|nr:glycosyl hydrolase [Sporosarcina sp. Marseille-Q4063]QUW21210.1 hypothetical protein JSQ81_15550 [Sporosarcina sp. Marseille-Q4063]
MKKILISASFVIFVSIVFYLAGNNGKVMKDTTEPTSTANYISPKEKMDEEIKVEHTRRDNNFLTLWENESESKSLAPKKVYDLTEMNGYNILRHNFHGFSLSYSKTFQVDTHQPINYIRLFNGNARIDITTQNVEKAWTNQHRFINTTLKHIDAKKVTNLNSNGFTIEIYKYNRPLISSIDSDLNYYAYAFVSKGKFIHTLQLKTNESNFEEQITTLIDIAKSFQSIEKKEIDPLELVKTTEIAHDISFEQAKGALTIKDNEFMMGVYHEDSHQFSEWDKTMETKTGLQMFYKAMDSNFDHFVDELTSDNRVPLITFLFERKESHDDGVIQGIINGEFDEFIIDWARNIKATEKPVLIRLGNEMNGTWSDWSHRTTSNDPDLYKLAFRRIVDLYKKEGAANVYFVWNPNNISDPYFSWNHASLYYPGDSYVDLIGLTAYNFGETKWNKFRLFDELYDDLYFEYVRMFPNKPFIVAEVGSHAKGGTHSEFIENMFTSIPKKYPNIKMIVWFNSTHAHFDFRLDQDEETINTYKLLIKEPHIIKETNER